MEEMNLKDENNKKLLDSVYQTAQTVLNMYAFVLNRTCNEMLKTHIEKNKQTLCETKAECETLSKTLNTEIQDFNWFKKARINAMLNFNALIDDRTENLAKILIVELNNCVINLIQQIDETPNAINEISSVADSLKKSLEKQQEGFKKYLVKDPNKFNKSVEKNNQNSKKKTVKKSSKKTTKQAN